ncbi:MAG: foldase protein PrsA [Alphaproteobacteria bacterium]
MKMRLKNLGLVVVATSALALAACDQKPAAQVAADPNDKVIATVNGAEIRQSDLAVIEQIMGAAVQQIPADKRESELTRVLIDLTIVAEAARAEGYMDRADVRQALRQAERDALYTAYLTDLTQEVSDADVEAAYAEMTANFTPAEEVSARHILVETEEEAKEIKGLLDGGADFAELAKEKSTGPSGANGGDLGYFAKEMMVAPFAEVAFAQEVGTVSDPVETQFGWHVIKVEDKRMTEAPALEEVRDSLMAQLVPQKITAKIEELRSAAVIDRKDQAVENTEETPVEAPAAQ